jgi:tetratricopeptide (TPR) repeat protein/DNA-binding CsgD family transcriptional regulator
MKNVKLYFLGLFLTVAYTTSFGQKINLNDPLLLKGNNLKYTNPDSSAIYFEKGYNLKLKEKDTINAINFLVELANIYSHNVNYGKSYDSYWQALLLADESNNLEAKANIYQGLGWLYGFYKREAEALKYFNLSNKIRKNLITNQNINVIEPYIGSNYFALVNMYRDLKDYEKVRVYIDSAYQVQNNLFNTPISYYLEAESGYMSGIDNDFENAFKKLNEAKSYFEINDPSYLVLINMFFGDLYNKMNDSKNSIFHYEKSLEISSKFNRHLNTDMIVYDSLSNVYFKQKNFNEAYNYLKKGKDLNNQIFGRKSENSRHLLEIKDLYRVEKDKQEDLIKQQRIEQLEYEDNVWLLKFVILIVTIIFLILFGYTFIRYIRNKHKNEKLILKEKQKLKLQKQSEILELKNKELAQSALRLIEKDEFINNIKDKLANQKDSIDVNVIKRILKTIQGTPTSNWKEFEARFTAVNQSFYEKLKVDFPDLKQTDQKICALVKLNFPSKDMAKLLGISVESVHTSRHRLRKKLNLERHENLEEFINQL